MAEDDKIDNNEPIEIPAGEESTDSTTPEAPTGADLDTLSKQYGMSPADVIKAYGEARTQMAKSNQGLADYKKRMEWAEQFSRELTNRQGLREHIEGFFENSGERGVPNEVRNAIDPVAQDVAQLKATLYSYEMNQKLDKIAKDHPMDQAVRDAIFERVYQTQSPDVEAHYWLIMGPRIAASKDMVIADQAQVSRTKGVYQPLKGGGAGRKADLKGMTDAEHSEALDNELASMFRRTE